MVLRAISDDYENMDQVILRDVAKNGAKLGLAVGRSDIVDALAGLIEDELAKAYFLPVRRNFKVCRRSMSSRSTSKHISTSQKRGWISIYPMTCGRPSTMMMMKIKPRV